MQTLKTIKSHTVQYDENTNIQEQYVHFIGFTSLSGPQARWQSQVFRLFWRASEVGASCAPKRNDRMGTASEKALPWVLPDDLL